MSTGTFGALPARWNIHLYEARRPGGDGSDPALYWVRSEAFSSGAAIYAITNVDSGTYTQWTFIDVDGNTTGDATSAPSTGDWATPVGNDVVMDTDRTSDLGEASWIETP